MPDMEVKIFNQKIKLSYEDNEKERLLNAVEELNTHWIKFSNLQGKVSDLKIISLITLELQDTILNIGKMLEELNFVWNTLDLKWLNGFEQLKRYHDNFGNCLVPREFKSNDGYNLGAWVRRQRSNQKNITKDRKKKLDSLDFVWELNK